MFAAPKDVIEASRVAASDASKTQVSKAKITIIKAKGKIESLTSKNTKVTIGGTTYSISGSRTKITIGGKAAKRTALKTDMECSAEGTSEAKKIDCK
jgi:hypothetical protein